MLRLGSYGRKLSRGTRQQLVLLGRALVPPVLDATRSIQNDGGQGRSCCDDWFMWFTEKIWNSVPSPRLCRVAARAKTLGEAPRLRPQTSCTAEAGFGEECCGKATDVLILGEEPPLVAEPPGPVDGPIPGVAILVSILTVGLSGHAHRLSSLLSYARSLPIPAESPKGYGYGAAAPGGLTAGFCDHNTYGSDKYIATGANACYRSDSRSIFIDVICRHVSAGNGGSAPSPDRARTC
jgi:hypothetical protein